MLISFVRVYIKAVFHYTISPLVPKLPIPLIYKLAIILGRINYFTSRRLRSVIRRNLRSVFCDKSEKEIEKIVCRVFENSAKHGFEILLIPKINEHIIEKYSDFKGLENIKKGLNKGKGIILALGHIGCYYLAGVMTDRKGVIMNDLVQDITKLDHSFIDKKILMTRLKLYQSAISGKLIYKGGFLRELYRILERNEAISLFVDAKASTKEVAVDFLGEKTYLQPGAFALALRTGCTVIPALTLRTPDNKWKIIFGESLRLNKTGDNQRDIRFNLSKYARWLEANILKYPDQWHLWRELHIRRLTT